MSQNKNVEDMQTANKELQAMIANLEETIAELACMLFGASSEKTKNTSGKESSTGESAVSDSTAVFGADREGKSLRRPKSTRAELYESLLLGSEM